MGIKWSSELPQIGKYDMSKWFGLFFTLFGILFVILDLTACGRISFPPGNTAPVATPVTEEVLVGAGDIAQCDADALDKNPVVMTARLLEQIPGTVFAAGDNVYHSRSDAGYDKCYDPTWGHFKNRTIAVPGNRDYQKGKASDYFSYFGAEAGEGTLRYHSLELGYWHIVILNSNIAKGPGSEQDKWLRADLAAN